MTLTFTFAGDEAGHASLNFGRGALRHLVLTLVAGTILRRDARKDGEYLHLKAE